MTYRSTARRSSSVHQLPLAVAQPSLVGGGGLSSRGSPAMWHHPLHVVHEVLRPSLIDLQAKGLHARERALNLANGHQPLFRKIHMIGGWLRKKDPAVREGAPKSMGVSVTKLVQRRKFANDLIKK
jgi:hypothetical protein